MAIKGCPGQNQYGDHICEKVCIAYSKAFYLMSMVTCFLLLLCYKPFHSQHDSNSIQTHLAVALGGHFSCDEQ